MTTEIRSDFVFPDLETDRLMLQLLTDEDAPALFEFFSDDDVTKYMDMESFTSVQQAVDEIDFMSRMAERLQGCRYGIHDKRDGKLIGTCGFHAWEWQRGRKAEIGYDLAKAYWGKGIMKEALTSLITFGYEHMNLLRIEALVLPEANQSMSVLRKLGFTQEGLLRAYGYWQDQAWDEYMFSLLRHEWAPEKP